MFCMGNKQKVLLKGRPAGRTRLTPHVGTPHGCSLCVPCPVSPSVSPSQLMTNKSSKLNTDHTIVIIRSLKSYHCYIKNSIICGRHRSEEWGDSELSNVPALENAPTIIPLHVTLIAFSVLGLSFTPMIFTKPQKFFYLHSIGHPMTCGPSPCHHPRKPPQWQNHLRNLKRLFG